MAFPPRFLRIGTRGSALALTQANLVLKRIQAAFPGDSFIQNATLVTVTTTGDRITDRPLYDIGGKGLFAKELEQALLANDIDVAVHSLKDMETTLRPGLILAATLEREDPRDVLISPKACSLETLPVGSVVGTCAPRRIAQILHQRPDVKCVPLRGNVDSRLRKLQEGNMDAIVLALAGLRRLGRQEEATYIFPESEMLPAVGQGAIALECREDNRLIQSYLAPLNHEETYQCITAERALLAGLQGSCRTPIGGHAIVEAKGALRLDALLASSTGTALYRTTHRGEDPAALGLAAANALMSLAGSAFPLIRSSEECAS